MTRALLTLAGISGLLAVGMGGYAAHGITDDYLKEITETAVQYHMWHTLAAIAAAVLALRAGGKTRRLWILAAVLFFMGTAMFGGAIYVRNFTDGNPIGFLAPWGGWTLMAGWTVFGLAGALSARQD